MATLCITGKLDYFQDDAIYIIFDSDTVQFHQSVYFRTEKRVLYTY